MSQLDMPAAGLIDPIRIAAFGGLSDRGGDSRLQVRSRYGRAAWLAGTLAVVLLALTGSLAFLQNGIEDVRFRLSSRKPTGNIALVDIDEASIAANGTWPWSRAVYARITDRLFEMGAAQIAFDIDLSSKSNAADDGAFEAALQRAGGLVYLAALKQKARSDGDGSVLVESRPLPQFRLQAWDASVDVQPDADGVLRTIPFSEEFGQGGDHEAERVLSLAAALGPARAVGVGRFHIDFGIDASRFDRISVADLLSEHGVVKSRVSGKTIIVGATAVELRDYFHVPRFGWIPGALVQAVAADTLLQGRALRQTGQGLTVLSITFVMLLFGGMRRKMSLGAFVLACTTLVALIETGALAIQVAMPVMIDTAAIDLECFVLALLAVLIEVDERRLKISASRRQANRLRVILDRVVADNFAGIVVVDQGGTVQAISAAARQMLGLALDAGTHNRAEAIIPARLNTAIREARVRADVGQLAPEPPQMAELELRPGNRAFVEFVTTVSRVPGPLGEDGQPMPPEFAVCLTFQDITERRRSEARISELAHCDSLTGLANRHAFLTELNQKAGQASTVGSCTAVLFFDLDRFKVVNDRLGHTGGDELLRSVAKRLLTTTEPGDVAARLGGDEFALLIKRRSHDAVVAFAGRLVAELGGAYEIGDCQSSIGISLGFAVADGCDADVLMRRADVALLEAKTSGGDQLREFDSEMEEVAESSRQLEQDLRDALLRGEFEVYYQRQVDVIDQRIIGVEALVRWRHPSRNFVSPATFIPLAERTGLIVPLGAWVLRTACADAARWPVPIKVSVNLSAVQLSRGSLLEVIDEALSSAGLAAERLDLELTESLLMDNDGLARSMLEQMRHRGIGLSLDDFGTGYSSLSYLKSFDIDKIKIDQSFVRDLPGGQSSIAIIRAVVSLAESLGLRVNAEGVETEEQLAVLRLLGCDEVQGYLHGKPEPNPAIVASLLAQRDGFGDQQPSCVALAS